MKNAIVIDNIDLELLKQQKLQLVEDYWDKPTSIVQGVIALLDYIQDKLEKGGDA
jgi:hypothetical protein